MIRRGSNEEDELGANEFLDGKSAPLENLVQIAVTGGIEAGSEQFYQDHPRFGSRDFIKRYIDQNALNKYAGKMASVFQNYLKQGKKPEELINMGYRDLASLVVSGKLLTAEGKEILLSESWQKKAGGWRRIFGGGVAKEILNGEQYLDETMKSFRDLYNLMKSGEYSQKFPQLAEAVSKIYEFGFLDATANLLYKNGQLKERQYIALKRALNDKTKQKVGQTHDALKSHYNQALAASIIAILGIGILASTAGITGNAIGMTKTSIIPAITFGGLAFILGIYLWLTRR